MDHFLCHLRRHLRNTNCVHFRRWHLTTPKPVYNLIDPCKIWISLKPDGQERMRPMWLQVTKLMPKILRAHIEAFLIDGPSEQDVFLM